MIVQVIKRYKDILLDKSIEKGTLLDVPETRGQALIDAAVAKEPYILVVEEEKSLEDYTVKELKSVADAQGIEYENGIKKDELIALLK